MLCIWRTFALMPPRTHHASIRYGAVWGVVHTHIRHIVAVLHQRIERHFMFLPEQSAMKICSRPD